MKLLLSVILSIPVVGYGQQAMSLQQALNRSIKDRMESAENFQKNYTSTRTDQDLASRLVEGGGEEKKRAVSSDEEAMEDGMELDSGDPLEMELED